MTILRYLTFIVINTFCCAQEYHLKNTFNPAHWQNEKATERHFVLLAEEFHQNSSQAIVYNEKPFSTQNSSNRELEGTTSWEIYQHQPETITAEDQLMPMDNSSLATTCDTVSNVSVSENGDGFTSTVTIRWKYRNKTGVDNLCIEISSDKSICSLGSSCIWQNIPPFAEFIDWPLPFCPYQRYVIGLYLKCGNKDGNVVYTDYITEPGEPSPPTNLKCEALNSTAVKITWVRPTQPNGPLHGYFVLYQSLVGYDEYIILQPSKTEFVVGQLKPWTDYEVALAAFNNYKGNIRLQSSFAKAIVTTLEGASSPPLDVTIVSKTNISAVINWKSPKSPNGKLTYYALSWRKWNSSIEDSETVSALSETRREILRLLPYTEYDISIAAVNGAGVGQPSQPQRFATDVGFPNEPQSLKILGRNRTSIRIAWKFPSRANGRINGYHLSWGQTGTFSSHHNSEVDLDRQDTSHIIGGLEAGTEYRIKLTAFNLNQHQEMLNGSVASIANSTEEDVPGVPRNVTIVDITNSSIHLEWESPKKRNGIILRYTVRWNSSFGDPEERTTNETSFDIVNLLPYTKYRVAVSAWTSVGQGPWSDYRLRYTDIGTPSEPQNVVTEFTDPYSCLVKWEVPVTKNGPLAGYIIAWTSKDDSSGNKTAKVGRGVRSFRIVDLRPDTVYVVKLMVFNKNFKGQKLFSKAVDVEVKTLKNVPGVPQDIMVTAYTNTSVTLQWYPPKTIYGKILLYSVKYKIKGQRDSQVKNSTNTYFVMGSLKPDTEYSCSISASTENGQGQWSLPILQKTDIGIPPIPGKFHTYNVTSSSLWLEWSKPSNYNRSIAGYYIIWWPKNQTTNNDSIQTNGHQKFIENLKPWTFYTFQLHSFSINKDKENLLSLPLTVHRRTEAGIPEPPIFKNVDPLNSTSILIEWEDSGEFVGPTNFTIYEWKQINECATDAVQTWKLHYLGHSVYSYVLHSLVPYTTYYFQIVATTDGGKSSLSNMTDGVRTDPGVSGPPGNFETDCNYSSTSANISWESPDIQHGIIEEYQLTYVTEKKASIKVKIMAKVAHSCDRKHYSHKLEDLYPELNYTFFIAAKTRGVSSFSAQSVFSCTLPPGAPPLQTNTSDYLTSQVSTDSEVTVTWKKNVFSERMGRIQYYSVIMTSQRQRGTLFPRQICSLNTSPLPTWADYHNLGSNVYQVTPLHWNPFNKTGYDPLNCELSSDNGGDVSCVIGWEKNCTPTAKQYCNGPLKPGKQYGIKLRAYTAKCYTETAPLYVMTAEKPVSSVGLQATLTVLAVLFVGAAIIVCVVLKKKNKVMSFNLRMVYFYNCSTQRSDATVEIVSEPATKVEFTEPRPLNFNSFIEHVKTMMADSALKFSLEFEEIKKRSPKHPCTVAELEENRGKNRWTNILPFDHSRVKLLPIDDEPGSDYINACYIPGFSSHREYIASQGPLPTTVDNFWRMVWEQRVEMIVTLTQCVERGKTKCEQYWPTCEESGFYGDLIVQMRSESVLSSYTIRIFDIALSMRKFVVKQMHFTHWPDFGCPESTGELINFVRAVHDHISPMNSGPILVHCSAGVGRTGTFIAVDRLLQHIEFHKTLDIYGTVLEMRKFRVNMVQTEDQYIYIHECFRDIILEKLNENKVAEQDKEIESMYANMKGIATTQI